MISRALHSGTKFLESIDDLLPGSVGTWFKILR
jgi:hypothetical protein